MPPLLLLLSLFFSFSAYAQVPESGVVTAGENCEAYRSIKKRSGVTPLSAGQKYQVVARNKSDGQWLLIQVGNQRLWLQEGCGDYKADKTDETGPGSNFDHYTLALSWHPAFCADNLGRPECGMESAPLVLHGLWPSSATGDHPEFCDGSRKEAFCSYQPIGLEGEALQDLAQWMPGVFSCLHRYQWHKHGSCSGLERNDYFDRSAAYTEWVRQSPPGHWLRERVGQNIERDALLAEFARWGKADSVSLRCQSGMLKEIQVHLIRPLGLTPDTSQLKSVKTATNCPRTVFLLP